MWKMVCCALPQSITTIWQKIFLPDNAPPEFRELQQLCNEIEGAELRRDARTARQFIASLPNELPPGELVRIVHEFIEQNFVSCARLPPSTEGKTQKIG